MIKKVVLSLLLLIVLMIGCLFPLCTYAEISYTRDLEQGMSGEDVYALQETLFTLGYLVFSPDGAFGFYTKEAVESFQAAKGLSFPDGIAGPWTIYQLNQDLQNLEPDLPDTVDTSPRTLSAGTSGEDVKILQQLLYDLGYFSFLPDGDFGGYTLAAVLEFQRANGLVEDGIVGNLTYTVLTDHPIPFQQNTDESSELIQSADETDQTENNNIPDEKEERDLYIEMTGEDVAVLQQCLSELGFLASPADGYFGSLTLEAVKAFQKSCGLSEPDGIVGPWTRMQLSNTETSGIIISPLADTVLLTEKSESREGNTPRFIIIHHMAGRLTGAACANYFVHNDVGTCANYCIGYDGDIACNVPENYAAVTSGSRDADKRAITIEVSDIANGDWRIPEEAQESLVRLIADIIQRNPQMGDQAIYLTTDEEPVIAAKNGEGSWDSVQGNILIHRWTSLAGTGCPEWHMISILPTLCEQANQLLK